MIQWLQQEVNIMHKLNSTKYFQENYREYINNVYMNLVKLKLESQFQLEK